MATLLDHLRNHLIGEGIVRSPRVVGDQPPMWLEPQLGAKAPGEGANDTEKGELAVVSAFLTGGIPSRPYESFWRKDTVDLWIRTKNAPTAIQLDADIRGALIDKRGWTMAGLQVIESEQWRPFQRLGSDEQGFTYVVSYLFEIYVP